MTEKQVKIGRVFMLIFGLILFISGLIIIFAGMANFKLNLINNFHFFISGGILIFLGLTWRKNKK